MSRLVLTSLLAGLLTATLSPPPALAEDVPMPKGSLNGAGNTCMDSTTRYRVKTGSRAWDLKDGTRMAFQTRKGIDWAIECTFPAGSASAGTACFSDGYVVAGREGRHVRLVCYAGPMPERFEY